MIPRCTWLPLSLLHPSIQVSLSSHQLVHVEIFRQADYSYISVGRPLSGVEDSCCISAARRQAQDPLKQHYWRNKLSYGPFCLQLELSTFATNLISKLQSCLGLRGRSCHLRMERMWESYHKLHTTPEFSSDWGAFLRKSIDHTASAVHILPICYTRSFLGTS